MTQDELIAAQDAQRTQRSFIAFLSGAFGTDQTYAGQDGSAANPPRQYITTTGYGLAVEGQPISNQQQGVVLTPMLLLLFGGLAFLALRR